MKCGLSDRNCEYCRYASECEILYQLDELERENRKLKSKIKDLEDEIEMKDIMLDELFLEEEEEDKENTDIKGFTGKVPLG